MSWEIPKNFHFEGLNKTGIKTTSKYNTKQHRRLTFSSTKETSTTSDASSKYLRPRRHACNFAERVCYVRKQKTEMNSSNNANKPRVLSEKEKRSFELFRHWIVKNFLLCVNLPPVSIMILWLSSSSYRYRAVTWLSLFHSLTLVIQMWRKKPLEADKSQIVRICAFCVASMTIYDKSFQFSLCKFFPFMCVFMSGVCLM